MTIRKASLEDIEEIMNVENNSFIEGIREDKNVFIERIKRCPDLFLVFEEDEQVAGYLSSEIMTKVPKTEKELELGHIPEIETKNDKESYIYISSFALLPSFRGNGRGKEMWNKSVEYLQNKMNINKFLLLVNEEWKGAYHIYENSGFKVINTFPSFFYSNNKERSNGILMEK